MALDARDVRERRGRADGGAAAASDDADGTAPGTAPGGAPRRGRRHVVAAVAVALLVAAALAASRLAAPRARGRWAVVHDADGDVHALDLAEDQELRVETSLGYNVVVVEGGTVRVADADCRGHDCVGQGRVSEVGEQVVCLPHRLWVEVSESPEGSGGAMDASAVPGGLDAVGG
jgi:hypothetical protein